MRVSLECALQRSSLQVRRVILDHQPAPVADMVAMPERTIDDLTGGAIQFDDIMILAVKRLGT